MSKKKFAKKKHSQERRPFERAPSRDSARQRDGAVRVTGSVIIKPRPPGAKPTSSSREFFESLKNPQLLNSPLNSPSNPTESNFPTLTRQGEKQQARQGDKALTREGDKATQARQGDKATQAREGDKALTREGDKATQARQGDKATVDKANPSGTAYLSFDDPKKTDIRLDPEESQKLLHGDRVLYRSPKHPIVVLFRRFQLVCGRLYKFKNKAIVLYERRRLRQEFEVDKPNEIPANYKHMDYVLAKMVPGSLHHVSLVEHFGDEVPARADLVIASGEFGLEEHWSQEAVTEAENLTLDLSDPRRKDLRHIPFFTIDGETARDFDDAIHVEKSGENYILYVAIADVSSYVKPGTAIDKDAYARATSVYFPERAFHMLPHALSEGLCSLRPNEPRLALVCKSTITPKGQRIENEVFEAIIESKRRATYTEIEEELKQHEKDPKWIYRYHAELYRILRAHREDRGSIDFELNEGEIRVDSNGEPTTITLRPRLDAHRLIEEFMISANEGVSEFAEERGAPFLYRIHEPPKDRALQKFMDTLTNFGIKFRFSQHDLAKSLQDIIEKASSHPATETINTLLLRSMSRARYSPDAIGHFGLASKAYAHFTSPIRRYPDLVVHRILKQLVYQEKLKLHYDDLEKIGEHCSLRERLASDAEREVNRVKHIRYMKKHLGDVFEANVRGVNERGIFVELKSLPIEGFVPILALEGDRFFFDSRLERVVGRKTRREFRIGTPIKVQCVQVSYEERTIEFAEVEADLTKKTYAKPGFMVSPVSSDGAPSSKTDHKKPHKFNARTRKDSKDHGHPNKGKKTDHRGKKRRSPKRSR